MRGSIPLISVIIPTKGRMLQLINAVNSVLNQTYKNFEIIIIDDSEAFVDKLFNDKRINHIWNETPNNNAGASRNQGIKIAKGEFIAFLDDDDEWLPTKLEKQMKVIERRPETKFMVCGILDKRYYKNYINTYRELISHDEILQKLNLSSTSSYLVNTALLRDIGGFDTNFPSAQEYELAIRLSKVTDARCVPEVLVVQNETHGQITKQWKSKIEGLQKILDKHHFEYEQLGLFRYWKMRLKFFFVISLYKTASWSGLDVYRIILPLK